MTDKEYLEKMIALTDDLNNVASAEPYDPAAWSAIMKDILLIHKTWLARRRRRPWVIILCIIALLCILALLVFEVVNVLYF